MSPEVRRLAAIDIGTVTTRLLVADVSPFRITEVARSTDITHLGEDLTSTGRLSDAAMKRVADTMSGYVRTLDELGAESVRAVATSASRDAANGAEFLGMLEERGVSPTIVPGSEEAYLSFLGATWALEGDAILVDDIGGGLTELVLGEAGLGREGIEAARSIDVGSKRLTEMFLASDPPAPSELAAARAYATEALRGYFDSLRTRPETLVSVAGTATTLVAIKEALEPYDPARVHGYRLGGADIVDLLEHLASLPLQRRLEVVGLHRGRASVIVAGALVLETVMALAGVDSTLVSEHDILYGILLDTYGEVSG